MQLEFFLSCRRFNTTIEFRKATQMTYINKGNFLKKLINKFYSKTIIKLLYI